MDEKPKSIWKKTLGRKWLGSLMMAVAGSTSIVLVSTLTWGDPAVGLSAEMAYWIVLVLVLWPLITFIRWLCCWRNLKRTLFGLACFATLIALFYAEENWRGHRAWTNYRHDWEAKGEKFDFKDFIPPPVPDEKNFAMTPVVNSCYSYILTRDGKQITKEQRDTNLVSRLRFDFGDNKWNTNATGYWVKGTTSNLKLWQGRYRELATKTNLFAVPPQPQSPAADVLLALGKYDATVEELRLAAQLPECRFPLNYDSENPAMIFLPHLAALKASSRLLQLRAIAELQNGQSEKALADVLLALRLSAFMRSEPTLISHLVRIAMMDIIMQPIYEGLAEHRWTDAQLVALDAELVKLDFLADFNFTLRCERAFSSAIIDYVSAKNRLQRYRELFETRWDDEGNHQNSHLGAQAVGVYLMPQGWFDQNKLVIAQLHESWLLRGAEPEKYLVQPRLVSQSPLAGVAPGPFNFFAMELIPSLTNSCKRFAREQISVDLARTAIALERFRLAHGEFPESLDALAPTLVAQVPHDVIGGQPLKYRRTSDGQFVLYSVGWNEKDDGGVTVIPAGSSQPKFEQGDWVWRYPEK